MNLATPHSTHSEMILNKNNSKCIDLIMVGVGLRSEHWGRGPTVYFNVLPVNMPLFTSV